MSAANGPLSMASAANNKQLAERQVKQRSLAGLFYWRVMAWWLVAFITTLSIIPNPDSGVLSFELNDKLAHFVCYAALAVCFGCIRLGKRLLVPMLLLVLMGAALELIQLLSMYGRMFDLADMLANGFGVLLGALLMLTPLRYSFYYFEQCVGRLVKNRG